MYPPAATWGSEGLDLAALNSHRDPTPVHVTRQNWIQSLLPYVNSAELSHHFNPAHPIVHPSNLQARSTRVSSFLCPSDSYNNSGNPYLMKLPGGEVAEFARGNFAMNGGSEWVQAGFGTLPNPGPTAQRFRYSSETREFSTIE